MKCFILIFLKVMSNDLSRGLFPADQVKLLVVDEAHRAQGDYAYCQVKLSVKNYLFFKFYETKKAK